MAMTADGLEAEGEGQVETYVNGLYGIFIANIFVSLLAWIPRKDSSISALSSYSTGNAVVKRGGSRREMSLAPVSM